MQRGRGLQRAILAGFSNLQSFDSPPLSSVQPLQPSPLFLVIPRFFGEGSKVCCVVTSRLGDLEVVYG